VAKKRKKKSLLPKRVGGVKVPKALRKGRAARFMASPAGVALLTDMALAAGAWTVAKGTKPDSKVRKGLDRTHLQLSTLADRGEDAGKRSAEALKGAFSAAATAFADALRKSADAVEPTSKKAAARPETARAH